MRTFSQDAALTPLPLPGLEEGGAMLAELIRPLVDADTLRASRRALEDFLLPDGPGERLYRELQRWRSGFPAQGDWLRPLWDDAYLAFRGRLPLDMNYAFSLDTSAWRTQRPAAALLAALARTLLRLGAEELEPERGRKGFLAMDQLRSLAYSRIPAGGADVLLPVRLAGPLHAAVVCRGRWFVLPLADAHGAVFSPAVLETRLRGIETWADALQSGASPGALTVMKREDAALLRASLARCPGNRTSLNALETALCVVCLDNEEGPTSPERAFLAGDPANRWFQASLQLIVRRDGLGVNFEHSGCDATAWLYVLDKVHDILCADTPEEQGAPADAADIELLEWRFSSAQSESLARAGSEFRQSAGDLGCAAEVYPAFGRARLKELGCSPDAFVQQCIQAAQSQVFGTARSCYEAVSMRAWRKGRTEVARPVTPESLELARALQEGGQGLTLGELFRSAEAAHAARLARCQAGTSPERLFFGLEAMLRMDAAEPSSQPPALFQDAGYRTLTTNTVSTSGVGAPFVRFFGFGPVVPDGVGVGYCLRPEALFLCVTAYGTTGPDPGRFQQAFVRAGDRLAAALK